MKILLENLNSGWGLVNNQINPNDQLKKIALIALALNKEALIMHMAYLEAIYSAF